MRWFVIALVAVLVAAVVSVGVLDRFGFLDAGKMVLGGLKQVKSFRPYLRTYELGLSQSKALEREWAKLGDARQGLDLRAKDVADKQSDLEQKRKATEDEVVQLEQKRNEALKAVKGAEQLDRVAKVCGTMKPPEAAKVLSGLADLDVAQVLLRLTDKQAGAILSAMEPRRASKILTLLVRP